MSHKHADPVFIVGGGITGASAAFALRRLGYDGRLVLVSAETALPYRRSPLSKGYLRGEVGPADILIAHLDAYRRDAVELLLGACVTRLDLSARTVSVRGQGDLRYDRLILGTGSIAGPTLPGARPYPLQTRADADLLRSVAQPGRRAVVLSNGRVGADAAASLGHLGLDVVVIAHDVLGSSTAGREAPGLRQQHHERRAVGADAGRPIARLEGRHHAEAVRTADGAVIEADIVVDTGATVPAAALAAAAGLIRDGAAIRADSVGATSDRYVFAAGDVATARSERQPGGPAPEERARISGLAAAAGVLGLPPGRDSAVGAGLP